MCASIRKTSGAACGPTIYLLTPTHDVCSRAPILPSTSLSDVHLHLPIDPFTFVATFISTYLLSSLSSPAFPTSYPLLLFWVVHLVHLLVNVHLLAHHLASLPIQPCRNSTRLFSSKMLMRQEGRITDRLPIWLKPLSFYLGTPSTLLRIHLDLESNCGRKKTPVLLITFPLSIS